MPVAALPPKSWWLKLSPNISQCPRGGRLQNHPGWVSPTAIDAVESWGHRCSCRIGSSSLKPEMTWCHLRSGWKAFPRPLKDVHHLSNKMAFVCFKKRRCLENLENQCHPTMFFFLCYNYDHFPHFLGIGRVGGDAKALLKATLWKVDHSLHHRDAATAGLWSSSWLAASCRVHCGFICGRKHGCIATRTF